VPGAPIAARGLDGAEDLLDQERVALRAVVHDVHELGLGGGGQNGLQLRGDLVASEARQLYVLHGAHALPAGQQRAQRVGAVELVGAVRDDEQYADAAERAYEQGDQVERGRVGPVEVLDDEHERPLGGEAAEDAEHELQQL
jgi:hypothetical protein